MNAASFQNLKPETAPAHWVMAQLGKRVLRPGGIETTDWVIRNLNVSGADRVVELAPGVGLTAKRLVQLRPASYRAVDRDEGAVDRVRREISAFGHPSAEVIHGNANDLPLAADSATVVIGEAMLSMQSPEQKQAIMGEAARVLQAGGRYGIHELAVAPDDIGEDLLNRIQLDLAREIRVGVRIGTVSQWTEWLDAAGFEVQDVKLTPMRLLEPSRLFRDEGLFGATRFIGRTLTKPRYGKRLLRVREVFRKHEEHLRGVGLVCFRKSRGD